MYKSLLFTSFIFLSFFLSACTGNSDTPKENNATKVHEVASPKKEIQKERKEEKNIVANKAQEEKKAIDKEEKDKKNEEKKVKEKKDIEEKELKEKIELEKSDNNKSASKESGNKPCKQAKFKGISRDKNKPTLFSITFFDTLATPTTNGVLAFPSYVATACLNAPKLPEKKSYYDCYDGKDKDSKKHAILQHNNYSKIGLYIDNNKLHIITRVQLDDNNLASVVHLSKHDLYQFSVYSPLDLSLSCVNENGEDEIYSKNVQINSYNKTHISSNGKLNSKEPIIFKNNPVELHYLQGKGVKLTMTLIGKDVPAVGVYNAKTNIHALDEDPLDSILHNEMYQ